MVQAVDYIKNNMKQADNQILQIMMELQLEDEDGVKVNNEERVKCATYLGETVRNMALHFNNKLMNTRYSSHIINLSVTLFLRSRSIYQAMGDSSVLKLPHPNTINKITREMKIYPGYNPSVYFTIKDQLTSDSNVMGHIMLDEIKLKNGLAWNCTNNEVTCFISDEINTTIMFENILGPTS